MSEGRHGSRILSLQPGALTPCRALDGATGRCSLLTGLSVPPGALGPRTCLWFGEISNHPYGPLVPKTMNGHVPCPGWWGTHNCQAGVPVSWSRLGNLPSRETAYTYAEHQHMLMTHNYPPDLQIYQSMQNLSDD